MTPNLEKIVFKHGSFPDGALALEGLDAVLKLAASGAETPAAITEALVAVVDQLGNDMAPVPDAFGPALTDWAERVAADPEVPASSIVSLLVNADTTRSYAVLQALAAQAGRPDLADAARDGLPEHHLAPQPGEAVA